MEALTRGSGVSYVPNKLEGASDSSRRSVRGLGADRPRTAG